MGIVKSFNKAKAVFEKATLARENLQKAERLAQSKRLQAAVKIAEKIISEWSLSPSLCEELVRTVALGDFLEQVEKRLNTWQRKILEAQQAADRAKALLQTDSGNPLNTRVLSEALVFFGQGIELIDDNALKEAFNECKREIAQRKKFQSQVRQAEEEAEKLFFKEAWERYNEAKKLYSTEALLDAIAYCSAQILRQEAYQAALEQARHFSESGKLRVAIALLTDATKNFPRSEGIELLEKWQRDLKGKELFRAGLAAEKQGNFSVALIRYREAERLLLDARECCMRQAIVEVKTKKLGKAFARLESQSGERSAYLRGFALAQQKNWQQAEIQWQFISSKGIEEQREVIKILAERDRLQALKEIEQLVDEGNLKGAKTASREFIEKFGLEQLVQANLNEHIRPRILADVWKSQDWGKIATAAEQVWSEQLDVISLHNWALATYYRAQTDLTYLADSIVAWGTALANINIDPSLKDIPWLGSSEIDCDEVFSDIKQLLEEAIEQVKEQDLNNYLQLRDRYCLEKTALQLMGNPPTIGIKVNNLFLTPGCYHRYGKKLKVLKVTDFPGQVLGALYTEYGLAVAACIEGDIARAIEIKPASNNNSHREQFARAFIAYHEGCHYLQHQRWRDAVNPLNQARTEIKASSEWSEEVDRLCGLQRQAISNSNEHLDFAKFWYDLLGSQSSRSYFAEYQADKIRERLVNKQIDLENALRELEEVKKIDPRNPIVLDLIKLLKIERELETINRLFKNGQFEEMVSLSKRSTYEEVRYMVAKFFIDILLENSERRQLSNPELIRQLGKWAYEICPNEPAFQEIYRALRLHW